MSRLCAYSLDTIAFHETPSKNRKFRTFVRKRIKKRPSQNFRFRAISGFNDLASLRRTVGAYSVHLDPFAEAVCATVALQLKRVREHKNIEGIKVLDCGNEPSGSRSGRDDQRRERGGDAESEKERAARHGDELGHIS